MFQLLRDNLIRRWREWRDRRSIPMKAITQQIEDSGWARGSLKEGDVVTSRVTGKKWKVGKRIV